MPAAGDFTCAELVSVQAKADEIWADNSSNAVYMAEADAAKAIISEQSAEIDVNHTDPMKDKKVKISWIEQCDMTPVICGDECAFPNTNEAQANCVEHEIDQCFEVSFTVDDNTFRTSVHSKEEVLAKQFLQADKALSEQISAALVAAVDSFKGTNAVSGGIGEVVGTNTFIAPSLWTPSVVAYLIRAGKENHMNNFYQLNGSNLFESSVLTNMSSATEAAGQNAMLNSWRQYWDLFNVDSTIGAQVSYLINRGSMAFASKARYDATPVTIGNGANQTRFKIASQNLEGVEMDVRYQTRCSGDSIHHDYVVSVRYGIFQSPINSCDTGKTGILRFECGTAP